MQSCICESGYQIEARHAHGCLKDMSRIENVRRVVREECLASNPTKVETVKVSELLGAGKHYPETKSNITELASEPLPEGAQLMNTSTPQDTVVITLTREEVKLLTIETKDDSVSMGRYGNAPLKTFYSILNVPKRVVEQLQEFAVPSMIEPREFGRKVIATVGSYNGVFMTDGKGTWIEVGDSFHGVKYAWSAFKNPRVETIQ